MTIIKVGDRVQWWEEFRYTKQTPRAMTGTVVSAGGCSGYVAIHCDDMPGRWVRRASVLTRIDSAAQEQANGL